MSDNDMQPTWFSSSRFWLARCSMFILFIPILWIKNQGSVFLILTIIFVGLLFLRIYVAYSGQLTLETPNPAYRFRRLLLGMTSIVLGLMAAVLAWHETAKGLGISPGDEAFAIWLVAAPTLWWITKRWRRKRSAL